jgi:hypothetical protein
MEPRVRRWDDLTVGEARALLDDYVAGLDSRRAAFLDEVRTRRGPIERLDFSRDSLGPLWSWVMATYPPIPATDGAMWAADPPWWYPFHAPLGQRIGPDLSRIVTGVAAYFAETVIRTRDTEWSIGKDRRMADFRQPLLSVRGRGSFLPDAIVLVAANQWASGTIVSEARLLSLYDIWAGLDEPSPTVDAEEPDLGPYSVGRFDGTDFDAVISFDDVLAHDEDDRLARLVEALGREPGVDRAVREDREVILVRAPRLDEARLRAIVDRLWGAGTSPH